MAHLNESKGTDDDADGKAFKVEAWGTARRQPNYYHCGYWQLREMTGKGNNKVLYWKCKICREKLRDKVAQRDCAEAENSSSDLRSVCGRAQEQKEVRKSFCKEMWPHKRDQTQTHTIYHQRQASCV